jgi:hypothetical protein
MTVLRLARFLAEAHIAPSTFLLDPRAQEVSLMPTWECWWPDYGGIACGGHQQQLQCVVSRRRQLVTSACAAHLWPVYQLIEAEILTRERQEAHRQARLATRRTARRHARESTTASAVTTATT